MSEMVERVAKAVAACQDELGEDKWRYCLPEARAAIAAMREPTAKMVGAGCDEEKVGYAPDGAPAEDVWRVMIDAALAEDTPS